MKGVLFFTLITLFISCSNEIDINDDFVPARWLFCVLDPTSEIQYVRVNRSFFPEGDPNIIHNLSDSVSYGNAIQIYLEQWNGNILERTITFKDTLVPRDSITLFGNVSPFYPGYNCVFYSTAKIYENKKYRIIAISSDDTIPTWAEMVTPNISKLKVYFSEANLANISYSAYNNHYYVEWLTVKYGKIYHPVIRFYYLEINGVAETRKFVDWNFGEMESVNIDGNQKMAIWFTGKEFFANIANSVLQNDSVKRVPENLEYLFNVGAVDLFYYIDVSRGAANYSIDQPLYSNIKNGHGLFSCVVEKRVQMGIREIMIDSLVRGKYTKHLGFIP